MLDSEGAKETHEVGRENVQGWGRPLQLYPGPWEGLATVTRE